MDDATAIVVRITAIPRHRERFRLEVSGPAASRAARVWETSEFTVAELARAGDVVIPAERLAALLSAPDNLAGQHLRGLLVSQPTAPVLLQLETPRLYAAAWDGLLNVPGVDATRSWNADRPLLRFLPRLAAMALVPLTVPVDVLIAELSGSLGPPEAPFRYPLKHFRTVAATRTTTQRMNELLRGSDFDIVHIRARVVAAAGAEDIETVLAASPAAPLRRLLSTRGCRARLVVIETDPESMPAARILAHRLAGDAGPTVLVATPRRFDFPQFYFDITHNVELSTAFRLRANGAGMVPVVGGTDHPLLLMARRGDETLLITRAETSLRRRADLHERRVTTARGTIQAWRTLAGDLPALDRRERRLADAATRVEQVRGASYLYDHESGGIEPMAAAAADLARATSIITREEAQTGRVVNTWFGREERVLPRGTSLAAGERYRFHVKIGPRLRHSIVKTPVPIPEDQLTDLYTDAGLPLRVVLFSTEFTLPEPEAELLLPRPPAASQTLVFDVIAPRAEGRARLRAGLYYQNNLLQSILVTAAITTSETKGRRPGNIGEVEWVLSGSLQDIERFGEKRISLLTNETPHGTHVLAVFGSGLRQVFEFGETEGYRMADEARKELQWVCGDPAQKEQYKFKPDNVGEKHHFRESMLSMAKLGYDLYLGLVTNQDRAFEAQLKNALGTPGTIQAVWMKSAKRVFPWSLVYDLPYVHHRDNEVCPDFLQTLEAGATADDLAKHPCITAGCPYRKKTNLVCPSGFWGFRHVIEQPLSVATDAPAGNAANGAAAGDAVDTIAVSDPAEVLFGYSETLQHFKTQRQYVQALPRAHADAFGDLFAIGEGLQRADLSLVYFYCHGGNTHGQAWLGVGSDEELYASNLHAWEVDWSVTHPLVFINGCNTVNISPDDLLTFNHILAWCRAAGVIGTEITIPEELGNEFGSAFLAGFLAGDEVGPLIRRLRLDLLSRYNPLGLAYTPYCLANLHLELQ